jgi:hypothetical protein
MSELGLIRDSIEQMSKFNQVEILRILHKHADVTLNENKYGIHVNLTNISDVVLKELKMYVAYVNTQEQVLKTDETQKETFKNIYFS